MVDSIEIDFHKQLSIIKDRESDYKSETGIPFPWLLLFWLAVGLGAAIWLVIFLWKKGLRPW